MRSVLRRIIPQAGSSYMEWFKLTIYIGMPVLFVYVQANPRFMGAVIENRQYVVYPPEADDADLSRQKKMNIKRAAAALREAGDAERRSSGAQ